MYTKNNQYPDVIPNRIRLSSGMTRTGGSYTEEELADAGYKYVGEKPQCSESEVVEWDSTIGEWSIRSKTSEEIQNEKDQAASNRIREITQLIIDSDWTQLNDSFADTGYLEEAHKSVWRRYRNSLKELTKIIKSDNIIDITLPLPPTTEDALRYYASRNTRS